MPAVSAITATTSLNKVSAKFGGFFYLLFPVEFRRMYVISRLSLPFCQPFSAKSPLAHLLSIS